MTALEQALRQALHDEPLRLPEPYGPDEIVFGDPRGPEQRGECHGWPHIPHCLVHQVSWTGRGPCWCCEAGIPGVTA